MSLTNLAENSALDWILAVGNPTRPTNVYLGLYTVAPDDTGGGTEVSGGSHARELLTAESASNSAPDGSTNPTATIEFAEATANWGTIVAIGVFDAVSGGNLWWYGSLNKTKAVNTGQTARFDPSDLTLSLD